MSFEKRKLGFDQFSTDFLPADDKLFDVSFKNKPIMMTSIG